MKVEKDLNRNLLVLAFYLHKISIKLNTEP